MKTRIGTSFGLALLLAIGVFATMLALGLFTPGKVSADPGAVVLGTVTNVPDIPGSVATYTIKFGPTAAMVQGDSLYVKFDSAIGVPATIEKERITMSASGGGTSNPLSDPEISEDSSGNTIVKLVINDADPTQTGVQNDFVIYDASATGTPLINHSVTFSSLAGISNSTSPSATTAWVKASDDGVSYTSDATDVHIPIYRWLELNDGSDKRGKALTLT